MHAVIFKNDAVGDLVPSLSAINNIIYSKKNTKVTVFLSERSEKFSFLIKNPNVEIKIINYDLRLVEKLNLLIYLFKNKVDNVYILSPKKFYFFLPLLYRKIKFYALCVNNINNYKRPNSFLRKFLFRYVVNEREKNFKRESTKSIQEKLTLSDDIVTFNIDYNKILNKSDKILKCLPDNYVYFHYKSERFKTLNWKLD